MRLIIGADWYLKEPVWPEGSTKQFEFHPARLWARESTILFTNEVRTGLDGNLARRVES